MADEHPIKMETLLRVEYKLDCLLWAYRNSRNTMVGSMQMGHMCPVCNLAVQYHNDLDKAFTYRTCGCKSGMTPGIAMSDLAPPEAPPRGEDDGRGEQTVGREPGDGGGRGPEGAQGTRGPA